MPSRVHAQIPSQILEEAANWFVEFRASQASVPAREEFFRWLLQSPQHIQAYLEITRTYADLAAMKDSHAVKVDVLLARAHADAAADIVSLGAAAPLPSAENARHRGRLRLAVAASVVIIAIGGLFAGWAWRHHGVFQTGIGEQRSITLADGSIVDLDANSRIRVRFTRTERKIDLIQGHALFSDVDDPVRPFVVRTHGILIRAIGTQFDVNQEVTATVVTVVEGKVAVLDQSPAAQTRRPATDSPRLHIRAPGVSISSWPWVNWGMLRPILVNAGEEVSIRTDAVSILQRADVAAATAWRRHQLVFDALPLADVVNEFNRYSRRSLVIASPVLAKLKISGVYASTDPASFIRFLRAQPGIMVLESDDQVRIAQVERN